MALVAQLILNMSCLLRRCLWASLVPSGSGVPDGGTTFDAGAASGVTIAAPRTHC
jgi:hypothetical protein